MIANLTAPWTLSTGRRNQSAPWSRLAAQPRGRRHVIEPGRALADRSSTGARRASSETIRQESPDNRLRRPLARWTVPRARRSAMRQPERVPNPRRSSRSSRGPLSRGARRAPASAAPVRSPGSFRARSEARGPRRLLVLPGLRIAHMELEHGVLGVVVGPIERQRPDRDVHALHVLGCCRLANTEMIHAGFCS
jgi:hypothetical protein